jgi:bifunctional enzyme CysN/CysC
MRVVMNRSGTVWLTGLSGAGKTTTAAALRDELTDAQRACVVIDGDQLRQGLSSDLGYDVPDRDENVRRAGEIALLLGAQGVTNIVALMSPRSSARRRVRARHDELGQRFVEVYISTPLAICEQRDPKGLYRKARAGERRHLSGVDDPYEAPEHAEVEVSTELHSPSDVAGIILQELG